MRIIIKLVKIEKNSSLSTVKHEMSTYRVIQQNFLQKWMELKKKYGNFAILIRVRQGKSMRN